LVKIIGIIKATKGRKFRGAVGSEMRCLSY